LWWLNGAIHFLATGAIGVFAWLAAMRLFRVLNESEKELLLTILPNRFQRVAAFLIGA
jgi:hypothetical protein